MFRNQYLITNQKYRTELPDFKIEKFGVYDVHVGEMLKFTSRKMGNIEIAILGILFDPLKPNLSELDILEGYFNENSSLTDVLMALEKFSGRFVFLFRKENQYHLTGDFRHSKKIIYSNDKKIKVITSSLKLYYLLSDSQPEYDPNIKAFTESKLFSDKQQDWPGEKTVDKNFKNLLPNHYLEFLESNAKRIPIFCKKMSFEEVVENSFKILSGTYDYLIKHYKLIQPLTAGWDSRILLGASLKYKYLIKYYIFRREDNLNSTDILLSQKIASDLKLGFSVFDVEEINEEFLEEFIKHNMHLNLIPKLRDIQYHFDHHRDIKNLINISGICGNLFRSEYGQTNKKVVSLFDIWCLSSYGPFTKLTRDEIRLWYDQTKDYAKQYGVSLVDLYFIEIRMAIWGSIHTYEQDIAIEEIDPFSNKSLMYPVLFLDKSYRGFSKNQLSSTLLNKFNENLLIHPCNPDKHFLRKYMTNNFEFRSLSRKLKFMKAKFISFW